MRLRQVPPDLFSASGLPEAEPVRLAADLGLLRIAARVASSSVAARRKKRTRKVTSEEPTFSLRAEVDLVADFEGEGSKERLLRKVKAEMRAALEAAMGTVARDLRLDVSGVTVRPVRLECAVTEGTPLDEDED